MGKFFVGQRVRLVISHAAENIGATGVLTAIGHWEVGEPLPDGTPLSENRWGAVDCFVRWDRPVISTGGEEGREFPSNLDRLAPVLDPGAAPSEYTYTELMDRLKAGEVERV